MPETVMERHYLVAALPRCATCCIQGKYAEAEPLYQRALAIGEKVLGPEHPDVVTVLENYAALLHKTQRTDKAAELDARGQAIRSKKR